MVGCESVVVAVGSLMSVYLII